MIECDYDNPESVLRAFFIEMNGWDIEFFPLLHGEGKDSSAANREKLDKQVLERLNKIFGKYCTPKDRAKQGRLNWIGVSNPPTYDAAAQKIVGVIYESPRRVSIDTVDELRRGKYRYVLLKKGGRWLVDHKKWFGLDDKWEKDFL